jgi:hypothetical protein
VYEKRLFWMLPFYNTRVLPAHDGQALVCERAGKDTAKPGAGEMSTG